VSDDAPQGGVPGGAKQSIVNVPQRFPFSCTCVQCNLWKSITLLLSIYVSTFNWVLRAGNNPYKTNCITWLPAVESKQSLSDRHSLEFDCWQVPWVFQSLVVGWLDWMTSWNAANRPDRWSVLNHDMWSATHGCVDPCFGLAVEWLKRELS